MKAKGRIALRRGHLMLDLAALGPVRGRAPASGSREPADRTRSRPWPECRAPDLS
ncbi:hypothetical protein [Streptomyces sp. NPDC059788]|uniref:hypothetical protein n=1 Tax=Streptomyces sp. NPDC059788 TaxID=3346948 RepID=UPI00365366D2